MIQKMTINVEKLNAEQKNVLEDARLGENLLILGNAGCGKSVLADVIIKELRKEGKNVIACAPTGAAAADRHGNTIHQLFGFPLSPCLTGKNLRPISRVNTGLLNCDVVLIDEISMVRCDIVDSIYHSLKNYEKKWGKKIQIICIGDMKQLCPPVSLKDKLLLDLAYERNGGDYYPFMAQHWDDFRFRIKWLRKQMRADNDEFSCMLDRVGNGDSSKEVLDYFNARIGENPKGIYLYARNMKVRELNNNRIKGMETRTYETWIETENFPLEISSVIPEDLELAIGMPVMITKNDTASAKMGLPMGYFNGLSGIVSELKYEGVVIDSNYGRIHLKPVIGKIQFGEYRTRYAQLPLVQAFAVTIHKAQGKTMKTVNIDPDCDQPGQAYVALSRVRRLEDLYLLREITKKDIIQSKKVIEFLTYYEDRTHVFSWRKNKKVRNLESDIISVDQRLMSNEDKWLPEPPMVYGKRKRLRDYLYSTYDYDVCIKYHDVFVYITDYAQMLLPLGDGKRGARHDYSNETDTLIRLLNFLIRSPEYSLGFTKQGLSFITPGMLGEYYDRYSANRLPKLRKHLPGSEAQMKERRCLENILKNLKRCFHTYK